MQKKEQDVKVRQKRPKKGKKFTNTEYMLSLIDNVNRGLESRIQESLEREAEVIKVLAVREKKKVAKKEAKSKHLQSVKEKLRHNSKGKGQGKGGEEGKPKVEAPSRKVEKGKDKKVRFK